MNSSFKYLVVGSLLLTACAQAPKQAAPVAPAAAVAPPQVEAAPVLPNVELTDELLYEYLLTEIASQRGHQALALEGSADLARKTRDPRLARRAAQFAVESGQMERAIEAFRQWQEVEPNAAVAGRMLSSILLRGGKLEEAKLEYAKQLQAAGANPGPVFLQLLQQAVSYPDKPAALKLLRELAQPYPQVAEARWSVAQLAQLAGEAELALSEARQARSLRPDWAAAVSLEAQLLLKSEPEQGLEALRSYLSANPDAREIRLQYARALLEQKQYKPARDEFQRLAKDSPDNPDMAFAIALISLQLKDFQGAEEQLRQSLGEGKKDQDRVQYYLGQLSEAKESDDEAMAHYREVKDGEHRFAAQLRILYLLNKRDGLEPARAHLQQIRADNNQQRVQLLLIEAQLLREAKRIAEAYRVLQQGLEKLPNHPDLLYETAMLADKNGKHDVTEQLLRKLIQLKPDHAHAYNALGYSLLERNERLAEALVLVEKALQLAPDDAAIMDSVGWGYYRSGRLDDSVNMLRRAYAGNPDPEVASHLGEVLWVRGDKEEAQKVWQDSLKVNPDSVQLQSVIKKFTVP
ncbi:MAG: tetratricopeptide repeat protein [Gallionella sp.]|nr:tetratricopeptide repeat protein [Gallionella sp.]MCK9353801.1 tetratricopeptide repeat protein [Gallionella sp.]